jgi:hypothetical protein
MSGLTDDMGRLCGDIRDLHSEHAAFLNDLKGTVAEIKSEVSQTKKNFRQAREDMAEKTRHDRTAFTADVRSFVSDLKSDASRMQEGFRSSLNAVARTGRSERGKFVDELRKSVDRLRGELLSDLTAIRRMWSGLTHIQPAATEKSSEGQSQEISPDELTKIPGIGPGIQIRLNQAGIYTYAQLARSTHEQLRSALGKFARLVDTYDWIGEARNLS